MGRRRFLETLAALVGIGITAPARAAAARMVELQRSPLAGFQYHRGEAVWPALAVGAALSLVREADNAYDARAVRVDWQGQKLGYVPRIDNAAVSHLLDAGHVLQAEIVRLCAAKNPWERVELAIFLTEGGARDHGQKSELRAVRVRPSLRELPFLRGTA
ncbi:MAG: HIRAN domain-containing protein [Burkholderiales bacterium]|nr:HIRAN domain-containing protein [Burkholderiales bacterium]